MTDPLRRACAALTSLPPTRTRAEAVRRHGAVAVWDRLAGYHPDLDPDRVLEHATGIGWRLLIPGDPDWPATLDGPGGPVGLWVSGEGNPRSLLSRAVTILSAKAGSAYGRTVAVDLAHDLTTPAPGGAVTIVAFAGESIAQTAALASAARAHTAVAVLDTPTRIDTHDRHLLRDVTAPGTLLGAVAARGAVVSPTAPGALTIPQRVRARIDLLAALAPATLLIEAGANDEVPLAVAFAAHFRLRRPVFAVPGPITSPLSAGPLTLLRDGAARIATSGDDLRPALTPNCHQPGDAPPPPGPR
ncbi:DNA-processing protein DprA [Parafrankia sp. BMG5.11]|uniref:DNA-processing protein DprA n=1 Tax=Parafrankia sp. BMG5.11 TaxID=222540 RepID=UPI00103A3584|nr:DNA-processing protein DprA [Parafrankia sp. BMG5.11]TCJ36547.1 SMF family protein [Parafrankia sp. BMG5.11]